MNTKQNINITDFGIEYEFYNFNNKMPTDKLFNNNLTHEFRTRLITEYYQDQYELNIEFIPYKSVNIDRAIHIILGMKTRHNLATEHQGCGYCGTHIHLLIQRDELKINRGLRLGAYKVTNSVMKSLIEYYSNLDYNKMSDDSLKDAILSLERLTNSHHIWQRFNTENKGIINRNLIQADKNKLAPYGIKQMKNRPVYWSPELGGKSFSLEIRCIPNLIVTDTRYKSRALKSLLMNAEASLNTKGNNKQVLIDSISDSHIELLDILWFLYEKTQYNIKWNYSKESATEYKDIMTNIKLLSFTEINTILSAHYSGIDCRNISLINAYKIIYPSLSGMIDSDNFAKLSCGDAIYIITRMNNYLSGDELDIIANHFINNKDMDIEGFRRGNACISDVYNRDTFISIIIIHNKLTYGNTIETKNKDSTYDL